MRTHRLGGWLFLVLGLASVVNALTARWWTTGWIVGGILAMVVILFAYSYFAWRDDPDKIPPARTLPGGED